MPCCPQYTGNTWLQCWQSLFLAGSCSLLQDQSSSQKWLTFIVDATGDRWSTGSMWENSAFCPEKPGLHPSRYIHMDRWGFQGYNITVATPVFALAPNQRSPMATIIAGARVNQKPGSCVTRGIQTRMVGDNNGTTLKVTQSFPQGKPHKITLLKWSLHLHDITLYLREETCNKHLKL